MDPAIRVANVIFDERPGGAHKRIVQVAERLQPSGIQTVVFVPENRSGEPVLSEKAGLEVRHISFSRIPRLSNPFQVLVWLTKLRHDVRRFMQQYRDDRISIAHVNGAFFLAPAIAARRCGIPLVWHLNDTIVPRYLSWFLGKIVSSLATSVVVAAHAVATHYRIPAKRFTIIYAPVDDRQTVASSDSHADRFRAGLVANWTRVKGIEFYLQAVASARREIAVPLDAVLAGARLESQRKYTGKLEALIRDLDLASSIEDHGYIDDTTRLIASLDVLVLSSRSEACPIVVLEAMSVGVPVVGTDVGGVREILLQNSDEPCGIVVPRDDPAAIARALVSLYRSPSTRESMGSAGKKAVKDHFSLDKCVERHRTLYNSLL